MKKFALTPPLVAAAGLGFEDFAQESHTTRNVGPNAVKACFERHQEAQDRGYVFGAQEPWPGNPSS